MSEIKAKAVEGFTLEDIVQAVLTVLHPEEAEEQEAAEQVNEIAVKSYKTFDDYPDLLNVKHIQAILGISLAKSYAVLNCKKCPCISIGKRKVLRKETFIQYLIDQEGQDLTENVGGV